MHAIGWKEKEIVQLLMDRGVNVNGVDKVTNHTPLHVAAHRGDRDTVRILLEKGAKIDVVGYDNGGSPTTPLLCALELGGVPWPDDADTMDKYEEMLKDIRYDLVKLMVDHGCDVNLFGIEDPTPLGMCSSNGDIKVFKLLLEAGADVNGSTLKKSVCKEGWLPHLDTPKPPIATAISANKLDIIIFLVQYGADIFSAVATDSWTGTEDLLEFAINNLSFKAALILLDAGCIVTKKAKENIVKRFTSHFPQAIVGNERKDGAVQRKQEINSGLLNFTDNNTLAEGLRKSKLNDEDDEFKEYGSDNSVENPVDDSDDDDDDSMPDTFSSGSDMNDDDTEKLTIKALMLKLEEVRSLKWQVRTFLRRKLGLYTPPLVQTLPLPKSVQEDLLCHDLRVEDYTTETS